MKSKKGLFIFLGVLAVILIFIYTSYNSMVTKEEKVKQHWGDLNNTYQRRTDLLPGLVATVKGASDYEKQVLQEVTEARAKASQVTYSGTANYQDYQKLEQTQGEIVNAFNRTLAVVENYPDLKSTQNFLYLQTQLVGTERRIKVARVNFNESVAVYNKAVRKFPNNIVAGLLGFKAKEGFTADAGAEKAPEINLKK
jgi:LemA protein